MNKIIFSILLLLPSIVSAQTPEQNRRTLALARIFISEAGFYPNSRDFQNIAVVLKNRSSQNRITIGIMKSYCPNSFNPNRQDERKWIAYLNLDGSRPRFWYENASWENHRSKWLMILKIARRIILSNNPRHTCNHSPQHWGSRWFNVSKRLSEGWTRLSCGGTSNQFWTNNTRASIPRRKLWIRMPLPAKQCRIK